MTNKLKRIFRGVFIRAPSYPQCPLRLRRVGRPILAGAATMDNSASIGGEPIPSVGSRSNNNKTSSNTIHEKEEVFDKTKK